VRALITGIGGFAGSHLADYLLAETDWQVVGCVLNACDTPAHLEGRVVCRTVDLRDPKAVRRVLEEATPDFIFHLAALADVGASWRDPWPTLENNIRAQLNLFEGLVQLGARPRVMIVSSNEVYGLVQDHELPISEENPLRPNSPYAVSKVAQDMLGLQYYLSYQLPVVRVRPFNHIGPRQAPGFVAPDFARQIAEAEVGQRPPRIQVGNLEAQRDFTDVRDMVRAYHLAVTRGTPGDVYNIGSGQPHTIRELLDVLLGCSRVEIAVETDPARLRPSDVPIVRCDASKFRELTGWEPTIPFETSLRDVLDDWRARTSPKAQSFREGGKERDRCVY
jgi:GDP-4-dehydro-6-deoxy-D-mannose reductase